MKPNYDEVLKALNVLLEPGSVTELRALQFVENGKFTSNQAGYFDSDHLAELAREACRLSATAQGVYIIPQPVRPTLLSRCANRVRKAPTNEQTADTQILRRRWLLIDLDPVRDRTDDNPDGTAGISASDGEKQLAYDRVRQVYQFLRDEGWPDPIAGDSGNGFHLLYRIDQPRDDEGLISRFLVALSDLFSDLDVKIDKTVFNPSRIWKLYGTVARKGDSTAERPHRLSKILRVPDHLDLVTLEQILDIAGPPPAKPEVAAPRPASAHTGPGPRPLDVPEWLSRHGLATERAVAYEGGWKWIFPVCPFNSQHTNKSACLIQFPSGGIEFSCHHNGCHGLKWEQLRDRFEPAARERREAFLSRQQHQPGQPTTRPAQAPVANTEPVWTTPQPLTDARILPLFPTGTLPCWCGCYVESLANATQVPVDLPALLSISVLSVALAGKFEVSPKPGWTEPLNTYTCVALESGNRKSANYRAMTQPLEAFERDLIWQAEQTRERLQARKQLAQEDLNALQKEIFAKPSNQRSERDIEELHHARSAVSQLEQEIEKTASRILADDVTPEACAKLLSQNQERLGVMSAEADIFQILAGRYSKSPNIGLFLKAHAGDSARVDRNANDSKPIWLQKPLLTLGITTQPSTLSDLVAHPGWKEAGLPARFLFGIPIDFIGSRLSDPPPPDPKFEADYRAAVRRLLDLPVPEQPIQLRFSPRAWQTFRQWTDALEPHLGPNGSMRPFGEWGNKLAGALVRIAGLFHVADRVDHLEELSQPIDLATVDRVLELASHLISHARAVFCIMRTESPEPARKVLAWIRERKLDCFTRRDVQKSMRRAFPQADALDAAFDLLEDRGWIRSLAPEASSGGRPPAQRYILNPAVLAEEPASEDLVLPRADLTGYVPEPYEPPQIEQTTPMADFDEFDIEFERIP